MLTAFIILSVISLLILVVAVVIMLGRGDDFIVGYNTASRRAATDITSAAFESLSEFC